ncbi:MAG: dNTP triphosphohydrolase [Candidatus Marinimicrobia bacterium]|nr:dNTP triphosphohydrolase [Candidatus Neomarinimicrobiota bacterium]MCF7902460.1 dNTP triphosphohydrolase [Candidatus Neomarinimicrobiota bacterium]
MHIRFPQNGFYTAWDQETLGERSISKGEYRNAFEIDRDRVIHSTAFRRLQGKTQVYVTGQNDQYRTRLTHSIEVAQIGRSIVNYLNRSTSRMNETFFIDPALVEAICLSHDLGNPPIGHQGESRLNALMDPWEGFEGNAQSLRILTNIIRGESVGMRRGGLTPTRALVDGILKYKVVGKANTPRRAKFLYPDQAAVVGWVHPDFEILSRCQSGDRVRSLECDIMDLADDIAYTTSDLFDGYKQRVLQIKDVQAFITANGAEIDGELADKLVAVLQRKYSMERLVATLIGRWIHGMQLEYDASAPIDSNRYRFRLVFDESLRAELLFFKALNYRLIYQSNYVKEPEAKGVKILEALFCYFRDVVLGNQEPIGDVRLSPGRQQAIDQAPDEAARMRLVCDHVSGMTDRYAIGLWEKLTTL